MNTQRLNYLIPLVFESYTVYNSGELPEFILSIIDDDNMFTEIYVINLKHTVLLLGCKYEHGRNAFTLYYKSGTYPVRKTVVSTYYELAAELKRLTTELDEAFPYSGIVQINDTWLLIYKTPEANNTEFYQCVAVEYTCIQPNQYSNSKQYHLCSVHKDLMHKHIIRVL